MTIRYIIIFTLICFTAHLRAQESKLVDKIVAFVGSELVLLSEVEEQFALMKEQNPSVPKEQKCAIIENLMVQKLLINQAKLDSIEVTPEEVEVQLDARIDRILSMMNNDIGQFEAFYGKTVAQVKQQFREDLKNQILADRMRAQATSTMQVTPAQVRKFFEAVPADSLPYFNAEVEIAEIVAKPQPNRVEKAKAFEKLRKLKKRIQDGEDFSELAQTFSDDPGSARSGGQLGWMKRGALVPEYEAAAYNLEKGELSDIVESEFGLHLIELIERRGNSINTRHILVKPEITEEDIERTKNYLDSVRQVIIEDSIPFAQAVQRFSDKKAFSYSNGGRLTNPNTGNTFFEVADLDFEIFFAIDSMEVNDITAPLPYKDERGEQAFHIVQLQSYSAPHRADLQSDYYKIQQAATEQRRSQKFYDWVTDKISKTYVRVETPFLTCPNMEDWMESSSDKF